MCASSLSGLQVDGLKSGIIVYPSMLRCTGGETRTGHSNFLFQIGPAAIPYY